LIYFRKEQRDLAKLKAKSNSKRKSRIHRMSYAVYLGCKKLKGGGGPSKSQLHTK